MTSHTPSRVRRPTQADVAQLAGVSQATVSYVLSERYGFSVPIETKQRVFEAARTLGYVTNQAARSLRTRITRRIAFVIPDISNPFFPAFARGIQDVTDREGYDLVMYNTDGVADKELRCLRSISEGRVDGVIVVPFHLQPEDYVPLLRVNIAVSVMGEVPNAVQGLPLDSIAVDQAGAVRDAVNYLIFRGHRRIGMVAGEDGVPAQQTRFRGYVQALNENGQPLQDTLVSFGDFTERGGYQAMQRLLSLPERPSAVFAVNDLAAIGAMLAIQEAGLAIPTDIAVIGFDDVPSARLVSPALTTISQDERSFGQRAAELLFACLAGKAPACGVSEQATCHLVLRASA